MVPNLPLAQAALPLFPTGRCAAEGRRWFDPGLPRPLRSGTSASVAALPHIHLNLDELRDLLLLLRDDRLESRQGFADVKLLSYYWLLLLLLLLPKYWGAVWWRCSGLLCFCSCFGFSIVRDAVPLKEPKYSKTVTWSATT